jgi:hypothetical protein
MQYIENDEGNVLIEIYILYQHVYDENNFSKLDTNDNYSNNHDLKDRSARHYCCACVFLCSFYLTSFLLGVSSILHLNTVESPLGYVACFLNLSF